MTAGTHRAVAALRVGAWAWIVTAAGHTLVHALTAARPAGPQAERAVAATRAYRIGLGGITRDLHDINLGVSLVMAVALAFAGVLCLLVARSAPALVTGSRAVSATALVASLVSLAVAVRQLPSPPIVLFTVAAVAFGVAVTAARPAA